MKAVISTTYDDNYFFFVPITTWLWNKLGVDVICFMPPPGGPKDAEKDKAMYKCGINMDMKLSIRYFFSPSHKRATYAQCSRLYAAAMDTLREDEILITSDVDMAVFRVPPYAGGITILGSDLVPPGQYPMCYATGQVCAWRIAMGIANRSYQECLDDLLGNIEAEHFRGNFWAKDQETLYNEVLIHACEIPRARPGTQFASNRIDRDDQFFMDRLSPDIIDYHMHRPGYTDENFEKILAVIKYFYPNEDLQWMRDYQKQFKELI